MTPRSFAAFVLAATAGLTRLAAQGGPPMITDDPGTPGDRKWEINFAWTIQRAPGSTVYGLPLLDANYGVGDRLQLNYQTSWVIDGGASHAGLGDSQLAVKWRFHDTGEQGWQASMFPRITFLNPGSHSDRRGLADSTTTFLLPVQILRDLGPVSINLDFGHLFSSRNGGDGWMGGILCGRQITKGWELDLETHLNTSNGFDRLEWIVNAGSRINLSGRLTLMIALGKDIRNDLGPRSSLLAYLGFQLRL